MGEVIKDVIMILGTVIDRMANTNTKLPTRTMNTAIQNYNWNNR